MRFRFTRRRAAALAGAAVTASALLAITGGASAALDLNNGTPNPFHLAKVGPINQLDGLPAGDPLHDPTANGFPYWYSDGTDSLELCLDPPTAAGDNCALTGGIPNPDAPITFPQVQDDPDANFPEEAFYWMGTGGGAIGTGANAGKSLVVMAVEAAFANGAPQPGDQMVFARTRMRIDIPDTAGQYTVVWPYGKKTFDAEVGKRTINVTQDVGITPGQFTDALTGNIGPFLRWDDTPPAAPEGFLGDAGTLHDVTGSPYTYQGRAANFFRIEGPAGAVLRDVNDATTACPDRPADANCIEYPQFTILGKKASRAGVEGTRAVYTRKGATTMVDLFGTSAPGAHLQVKGTTIPSTDLDADVASGFYFSRVAQQTSTFDPNDVLTLRNLTDQPNTRSIVRMTDGVVIDDATYYNSAADGHARGDLVVTAHTTDDQNSDPLTVIGVGELPAGAAKDAPRTVTFPDGPGDGVAAPPATIRVTSTHGGSASVAVKILGDVTPPAPTTAIITATGSTAAAGHVAMLNTLTLAGATSGGDYGAWRWTINPPTSAAAGFDVAAHTPTLESGALTGTTADPAQQPVAPIKVQIPGAANAAQNVAGDVSFTLTLYPDQASLQADTGALSATTLTLHVDPAVTTAARLAAPAATPQRNPVTLDATASTGTGSFQWEQLDPDGTIPAATNQAALKALPGISPTAATRIATALGTGARATLTMPDSTDFVTDGFSTAAKTTWHLRFRVRAKSALGAVSDSVAVVDVPFRPDALTALNGKYDANKNQLRIRGNAAVFGVTNTVRVYAGSRSGDFDEDGDLRTGVTAPPLLGSQLIAPDGTFDLRVSPSNPALPNGRITLVTTAGAIAENAPAGAIIAVPLAASRVVASVARKVRVPAGKVRVRLVIKAKAKRGNRCLLRTTRKALQRKTCGLKQTVFNITAKRGTVVYVQISGKQQKTVNTRKIRL